MEWGDDDVSYGGEIIVEIAGQQFRVEKGQKIYVHHLEAEEGKNDTILTI